MKNDTFSHKNLSIDAGNESYNVTEVKFSSSSNSTNSTNESDLAVLVLEKSINFSVLVQTVSISSSNESADKGFVVGLGDRDSENNSTSLSQHSVSILNSTQCAADQKTSSNQTICAEVPYPMCKDNEFLYKMSSNGNWTLMGIASNLNCDGSKNISTFTNIGFFDEWINEFLK